MKLFASISKHPETKIFREIESNGDEPEDNDYEPTDWQTLPDLEGFFVLKAFHVVGQSIKPCYMNIVMTERINDFTYVKTWFGWQSKDSYKLKGNTIPAVAIEGFGQYDLYFSKTKPELGISILESGLKIAQKKSNIALDLGYIYRDLGRREEAISAFNFAIEHGSKNGFDYAELANLYKATDDAENAARCATMAKELLGNNFP